jgi:hypothetical protein
MYSGKIAVPPGGGGIQNKEQFDIHNEFIAPQTEMVTCILTIFSTLFVHTLKINA